MRNHTSTQIVYFVEETTTVHVYDIPTGTIAVHAASQDFKFKKAAAWTILKNDNFFYTGGVSSGCYHKSAWEIDRHTYSVVEREPMIESRCGQAICNFKDVIYVFAGFRSGGLSSAERYTSNNWQLIAPLTTPKEKSS